MTATISNNTNLSSIATGIRTGHIALTTIHHIPNEPVAACIHACLTADAGINNPLDTCVF
eukprot:CAMPEP_0201656674 /NCGR_PEP_ID=MMETSP0494-20130426/62_1 /ASSEMBLY_ACC=CAM_ASM_000839 /TAXON_ID=420259 /ORGANISM="Thalassiosira gravida, Strain GMp14c1" /LENGTH=59 /DNA_ID=CAMNT_0048133311 /DNA_START=728 /DNA_END=904 /DNA_ORIENTATION=+